MMAQTMHPSTDPLMKSVSADRLAHLEASCAMLRDMHQITMDLLNHQALDDLLQTIVDRAAVVLDAPYAEIALPTPDGKLRVRAVTDNQRALLGDTVSREEAILAWRAFDTGQPVTVDDYSAFQQKRDIYSPYSLHAVIEIPIVARGRSLGVLDLGRSIPNYPFTAGDMERGMMLAQLAGMALINHDLREQSVQLEVERQRAHLLAEFIRDVSHEFRTPLSVIQSSLYLLNKTNDPTIRAKKSSIIEQQVHNIDHLITMLTLQAAVDSEIISNQRTYLSVNTLIDIALEAVRSAAEAAQHTIEVVPLMPDCVINVHTEYVGIALQQILINAVRYTPPSGHITVRATHADGKAYIAVQDTGVGIPHEMRDRIFTRFYRIDNAHSTPGFGLGLSIAVRVVEQHGGHIIVDSTEGQGSTFTIVLPIDHGG